MLRSEPYAEKTAPSSVAIHHSDTVAIPERIPELDGIRGIAAIMVVFHHIAQAFPGVPIGGFLKLWLSATHAGWIGVDIFFALSGFLITRILLKTKNEPHFYRNFYARRVLRLAPPYLITLVLIAIFVPDSGKFLVLSFFYLSNVSPLFGVPMVYGLLWSLAVEEHFYLIWPWLVRFLNRRMLAITGLSICIGSPIFRFVAQKQDFFVPYYSWFRFDGLMWGALLAVIITAPRSSRAFITGWSAAVGLIGATIFVVGCFFGAMGRQSVIGSTIAFGAVAMTTTGIIGLSALGRLRLLSVFLKQRAFRFSGDISYWMYLFHGLVVDLVVKTVKKYVDAGDLMPDWKTYLVCVFSIFIPVIVSGILVRRWIELPALQLKKNFR